jgi:predicted ArsR family transcriptional regulator
MAAMQGIEPDPLGRGIGLGESQRTLLFALKRLGEGTLGELEAGGLARETVRDHLKALQALGLVERAGVRREGRGRPQVLYRLTDRGGELFPQREGELLGELAGFLLANDRRELLERFFAERNRAKRERLLGRLDGLEGRARLDELAAAMTEDGFLAEVSDDPRGEPRLRLCHCPWRRLVEVSHLPCRAEMGLVSELLGRTLERESFLPDGDSSCTYSLAGSRSTPATRAFTDS